MKNLFLVLCVLTCFCFAANAEGARESYQFVDMRYNPPGLLQLTLKDQRLLWGRRQGFEPWTESEHMILTKIGLLDFLANHGLSIVTLQELTDDTIYNGIVFVRTLPEGQDTHLILYAEDDRTYLIEAKFRKKGTLEMKIVGKSASADLCNAHLSASAKSAWDN